MAKYYISIVVLIVLLITELFRYKRVLAATVVYPVMWILAFAGCIYMSDRHYQITWVMPIVVTLGYVLFIIGFKTSYGKECDRCESRIQNRVMLPIDDLASQIVGIRVVFWIDVAVCLITVRFLHKYVDVHDFMTSWARYHYEYESGIIESPFYISVLRYFMRCSLWYYAMLLFCSSSDEETKNAYGKSVRLEVFVRLVLSAVMSVLVLLVDVSRNDILFAVLPLLFILLLGKKCSNRRIIAVLLVCFVMFFIVFVWYSSFRRLDVEQTISDSIDQNSVSFFHYLSGAIVALDRAVQAGIVKLFSVDGDGRYTLSTLAAVSDRLFGTTIKPYVVMGWISIGTVDQTNVYTVYHWLAQDFGIIYSLVFQFFYGLLYGWLYGRMENGSAGALLWYSVLSYPLVMMFFEDQYLSIGQTWVIIIAFEYFIFILCNRSRMKIRGPQMQFTEMRKEC